MSSDLGSGDENGVGSVSDDDLDDEAMEEFVPPELRNQARTLTLELLPLKSRQLYTAAYNAFKTWRRNKGSNSYCEDVLMAYFGDLSKKYASSTLWTQYPMLGMTLMAYNQIDIKKYKRLKAYLHKLHRGHKPNQSLAFSKQHVSKYLSDAPDDVHLAYKVALLFGVLGAMRRIELTKLCVVDVSDGADPEGKNFLVVKVKNTKTKIDRSFVIDDQSMYDICKKYMEARKLITDSDRFFMRYSLGKCVNQPMGINSFGGLPKKIAKFLKLSDSEKYTGHAFRRTSATFVVQGGGDIITLKRHGGWKSNPVAESYYADSEFTKKRVCKQICDGIIVKDHTRPAEAGTSTETLAVDNSNAPNELGQRNLVIQSDQASNVGAAQPMDPNLDSTPWDQFESVEYENVCANVSTTQEPSMIIDQTQRAQRLQQSHIPKSTVMNAATKKVSSSRACNSQKNSSVQVKSQGVKIAGVYQHVPLFKKTSPLGHHNHHKQNHQSQPKVMTLLTRGGKATDVTLKNQSDSTTAPSVRTFNGSKPALRTLQPLVHDSNVKGSNISQEPISLRERRISPPRKNEFKDHNGNVRSTNENIDPQIPHDSHAKQDHHQRKSLETDSSEQGVHGPSQNITIAQNAMIETNTSGLGQRVILCEPRMPVIYHPDVGLCIDDAAHSSTSNNFVFNNCNVTINGSYCGYTFNNCKIIDVCGNDGD